jgi:hypothetical protein
MRSTHHPLSFHVCLARRLAPLLAVFLLTLVVSHPASVRAVAIASFELRWVSNEADPVQSVAWGDYDHDGDPDLAVGSNGQPLRVYRNDNGQLTSSAIWSSFDITDSASVVWSDQNGDGAPDIILGNQNQFSQIFLNNGSGNFSAPLDLAGSERQTFRI